MRVGALATLAMFIPTGLAAATRAWGAPTDHHRSTPCTESLAEILDLAATAEALAVTFYYRAIQGGFFVRLPTDYQNYLRAALDQEWFHYRYLVANGATPLASAFYFAPGTFDFDGFVTFITVIEALETDFIGAYLAAARKFAEMGQPVLAEVAGQILGIEAEHRIVGRELAGNSPPPPNNLCFEKTTIDCVAQTRGALSLYIYGGRDYEGPVVMPSPAEIEAAVGAFTCGSVPLAAATTCEETVADILNVAATAEVVGITFYYEGIRGTFFRGLSVERQWYLQAALDEERTHLRYLVENGAAPATTELYFPDSVFENLPLFLATLDTLENAFISAYLAAMQRFAQLDKPLLAQTAGQIMGVEAEHRVLGRAIAGLSPINDLCLERARYTCVGQAATELQPFLQGGAGYGRQASLPSDTNITAAVDRFGCATVATASYRVYFPHIAHKSPTRR